MGALLGNHAVVGQPLGARMSGGVPAGAGDQRQLWLPLLRVTGDVAKMAGYPAAYRRQYRPLALCVMLLTASNGATRLPNR